MFYEQKETLFSLVAVLKVTHAKPVFDEHDYERVTMEVV